MTDLRGRVATLPRDPVLADATGRRARRLRAAGRLLGALFLAWLCALLLAGLGLLPLADLPLGRVLGPAVTPPRLPDPAGAPPARRPQLQVLGARATSGDGTSPRAGARAGDPPAAGGGYPALQRTRRESRPERRRSARPTAASPPRRASQSSPPGRTSQSSPPAPASKTAPVSAPPSSSRQPADEADGPLTASPSAPAKQSERAVSATPSAPAKAKPVATAPAGPSPGQARKQASAPTSTVTAPPPATTSPSPAPTTESTAPGRSGSAPGQDPARAAGHGKKDPG